MLGLEGQDSHQNNLGWSHVYVESNIRVMSIGFKLHNLDGVVNWKGPYKKRFIKQLLEDVYWGELEILVDDAPLGTYDKHILIVQFFQVIAIRVFLVTTSQQVSLIDKQKEVNFCKKVGVPILGVVENISGLCQPLTDFWFSRMIETVEHTYTTVRIIKYMRKKASEMLELIIASEVLDNSASIILDDSKGE
ncbi:hypothetical protein CRYUN_Cryun20dG0049200 [Craigia yunnanensis]